ncbi:MAG TPA: glycoside hydrolase family 20 zincin-like fold domain-containing protein, partial [Phycisphaerae bacterium]|nr:glycoside hydrolase family 20 zincin-like fold domain-containing protein [Phycisphaerae bacterium]
MRVFCSIVLTGWLTAGALAAADAPPVNLVPGVSEVHWGESIVVAGGGAIVLSEQAGPPERSAARLLSLYVQRRFGQQWPTRTAKDVPADARLRVYLGQRRTFPELDRLCKEQQISVPEQEDGYALKVWGDGETITAVVAGMNGRGVIYGQDTLFQLFGKQSDKLTVRAASIRDWPTIPLRGRPHPHYQYFLKSENFDCIMTSRINFIDLRDGIYAFEPGAKLDREALGRIIRDARDHGLRIYAAVNCGIPTEQQDAAIATFKEFLDLGADALWASFDDRGAGGAPGEMMRRILALGRDHNIAGDAIAVTPPKGDYQTVKTRFNREVMAVPGMEQAVWYFTSVPCAEDVADGEEIGLRIRPSWWHNWPRLPHPSLHSDSGSYVPFLNLSDGWNRPNDRELREMGRYVHAVMPWDGWQTQQHYLVPSIGWWSWRPEQYDFQSVRRRAYDMVFGPAQVETAAAFDDALSEIQDRFQFWSTHTDYAPQCPPRLRSLDDRGRTQADLQELQAKATALRQAAVSASVLDRDLLAREYLDAMAREVRTGLAATQAPYPEYWWQEHQDAVMNAIYDGDRARADQLIAAVRERVLKEVSQVEELFGTPGITRQYAEWWRNRANANASDWQKLLARRQGELRERIAEYDRTVAPIKEMLSNMDDPPIQVGTGV